MAAERALSPELVDDDDGESSAAASSAGEATIDAVVSPSRSYTGGAPQSSAKQPLAMPWSSLVAKRIAAFLELGLEKDRRHYLFEKASVALLCQTFVYANDDARAAGKRVLLDAWEFMLSWASSEPEHECVFVFEVLVAVMRRREWFVSELAFSKSMKPQVAKWEIAAAVRMRDLLVDTVELASAKGENLEFAPLPVAHFCARVLATAYFSVPNTFGIVVDALLPQSLAGSLDQTLVAEVQALTESDKRLAQRLAQSGDADGAMPRNLVAYPYLFRGLPASPRSDYCFDPASPLIAELAKRQLLFCLFLKELMIHIRFVFRVSRSPQSVVPFCVLPGFPSVLLVALHEMGVRDFVREQPSWFVECTRYLLLNPYVLRLFLNTLFVRTNVHSRESVIVALDRAIAWFRVFMRHHSQETIANTFDPTVVHAVVAGIIDHSEHFVLVCRALHFVYTILPVFSGTARMQLFADFLLKRYFFALFCHWNITVRGLFQHLLLYRGVRFELAVRYAPDARGGPMWSAFTTGSSGEIPDAETAVDMVIASKIDAYIGLVADQARGAEVALIPAHLRVYAERAMAEFAVALEGYAQWRAAVDPSQGLVEMPDVGLDAGPRGD